ncbi:beta-lactamase/transpeptidase-like protein [Acephala macrosclerotiorum]|nr:beta-lactamase/transpeptidase-like protein [Acephala macrosclerotiorum]
MSTLEEKFEAATAAREIPGTILLATSSDGKFQYSKAFGPATPTKPLDLNATIILASCTKLMTTIAALQCVDRGQIGLDDEVSGVLHELKDPKILTGFTEGESGEPIYEASKTAITVRHLLTHTSGLGHDLMHPIYPKWRKAMGHPPYVGDIHQSLLHNITIPLMYEPGTSWSYGVSHDWAGELAARLNNTTLEDFMEKNIWTPLGIKNLTFHQDLKPDVKKNLVKMTSRNGPTEAKYGMPQRDAGKVEWSDEIIYEDPTKYEAGGGGACGSPVEFLKIVHSILANDGKLLKSETIGEMFKPQLGPGPLKAWIDYIGVPMLQGAFAIPPAGTKIQWGIGGMLWDQDAETGKKKGTLCWSGLPNLMWTIDREAGLACMYAGNVIPFGDFKSGEHQVFWEKEIYGRYEKFLKEGE